MAAIASAAVERAPKETEAARADRNKASTASIENDLSG
jgi:hypothetical protein